MNHFSSTANAVLPAYQTRAGFLGARWGMATPAINPPPTFAIVGLPYDGATTNRPGARFGPSAIRQASTMLCDATHPLFAVSPTESILDYGDLNIPQTNRKLADEAIVQGLTPLLTQSLRPHLIALGGDHSVTLSLLRLQAKALGQPLALIHFDAHCDTWEDHFTEPSGHGTWVHEAVVEGLIDPTQTVQIGLRSAGEAQTLHYIANRGGLIQSAHSLRGLDGAGLSAAIEAIHHRLGDTPTYLTLDIDCLDPAFAPGTGTPEPAGMTSSQLMTYLECLSLNFVGMDCVEVAPAYDHAQITALVAAYAIWTYLCARLAQASRG